MQIKRGSEAIADVFVKESSYTREEINGEFIAYIEFDIYDPVDFTINDHIEYLNNTYYIRYKENVTKEETSLGYSYKITLYHELYRMHDVAFFPYDTPDFRKNMNYYTGNAEQVAGLIVKSMNRVYPGWSVGIMIESKTVTFDFKDKSCAEVLQDLLNTYETEYWVEGKVLNFGKRERSSNGLVLAQGAGFRSLTLSAVDDTPPITRLYAYGSDVNINAKKYGSDYLSLPNGVKYIEKNVNKYGVIEYIKQFDKVFPHRIFEVTEKIDDFTLCAAGIDFDINGQLIDEVEVIVTFQDGGLAGYDLAIVDGSWQNDTKRFKLAKNSEENALEVPGDINFDVGDKFILTGLEMPQSDTDNAEQDLLAESQKFLGEKCENRVQLQAPCDEIYFAENDISVSCGQMLGVFDAKLNIDREIRVTAVKHYIENDDEKPYRYELTISDFLQGSGLSRIINEIKETPSIISRESNKNKQYTKRRFRDAVEIGNALKEAFKNFSEGIDPVFVRTMQLLVGDVRLQYRFVNSKTNPAVVDHAFYWNSEAKLFSTHSGIIQHMTLGIDTLAPSHAANEYKFWDIDSFLWEIPDTDPYWLYAVCSKTDQTATFKLSKSVIEMEGVAGYYHLIVGYLNGEYEGERSFTTLYGFTEILPGRITTNVIQDPLARLIIDLVNARITAMQGAEIVGAIRFLSGSSGYDNISDKPDLTPYDDALTYIDNVLPDTLERLQAQIDDQIESWFYHYDPSMSNVPASEWTTDQDRGKHLDDTFTNLDTGQSWRFTRDAGNVYKWTLMADTAASQALVLAGQAMDTADGKRRVFTNTPYPPYDVGDLWAQGANGDIMRCRTARKTGSYVATDWEKASKYTDDSAALAAIDNAVRSLNTYINGAFADGIVSEAEAIGIEMYLNVLATEKANVDAEYTALYGEPLLTGTAKSNLSSAKAILDGRYSGLVSAIQTAISDGTVTGSEKSGVNTSYVNYRSGLSVYSTRYEEARSSITANLNVKLNSIDTAFANALASAKNDLAQRMGYGDYNALVAAANAGKTIVNGGYIRTSLIDATAIVTGELVAQRLTAAMIAALDITTSRLTVTSGAKIGNFSISGGWLESTASAGSNKGYIDMRSGSSRVAFGENLYPSTSRDKTCAAIITNNMLPSMSDSETICLDVSAAGDYTKTIRSMAMIAQGGIRQLGTKSIVEEVLFNGSPGGSSGSSATNLKYYNGYVGQTTNSAGSQLYLPSDAAIESAFGSYFKSGRSIPADSFIKIRVLTTRFSAGPTFVISPASSTPLINNGNTVTGNGFEIGIGRTAEFVYFNRAWYVASKSW